MTKMTASDTRVERGVGNFESDKNGKPQYFGYAKRSVMDDPDDLYEYRYDEFGPFDSVEAAKLVADKAFAKMPKSSAKTNAAYEEGGAGHRLAQLRAELGDDPAKRARDSGEVR